MFAQYFGTYISDKTRLELLENEEQECKNVMALENTFLSKRQKYLNGCEYCPACRINDVYQTDYKPNCIFVEDTTATAVGSVTHVVLKTTRKVKDEEEFYVDYGSDYWTEDKFIRIKSKYIIV